ncbi:hypothetical protein C2G38_2236896 [Gigaspora rosea]|uniref:BTB domain-containing protein n=1 Tax=Gigaspora rosea TaxID=44941 RepID=A0A397TNV7_9GLOM|nr:hypothetical protein C2G38_2236896 [Gigaspora rosea]
MKLNHLEKKISSNYLGLLNGNENFNVIINVGEFPNIKSFQAHSAILRYRPLSMCLLKDFETSFIFEFTFVAHEFLLDELAKNLESYLIESQ